MRTILIGIIVVIYLIFFSIGLQPPIYNSYRSFRNSYAPCTDADNGFRCKNCSTLQYCNGATVDYEISCSAQFPDRQYCSSSNNSCVSNQDACQDNFICPDKGLFPDLLNCKKYFSCPSADVIGFSYQCMYNSVYSHANKSCLSNAVCFSAKQACNGQYKVVSYPPDPSSYIVCQGNDNPKFISCPKGYIYNPAIIDCDFKCPSEGNFPDPLDSTFTLYFVCVSNNGNIIAYPEECPPGLEFFEDLGTCVDPS